MRWFKFFFALFILSLIATGATYYWKTQYPAERVAVVLEAEPSPQAAPAAGDGLATEAAPESGTAEKPAKKAARKINIGGGDQALQSSDTQDLANMLSIVSSVVSLVGTLISLVLAVGLRRGRPKAS